MDVGHIILGRPWLFDLDLTIYGRTNQYSFVHNGKRVKIMPTQPKPPTREKGVDKGKDKLDVLNLGKRGDKGKGNMKMNLISRDQIKKRLHEDFTCYALVADQNSEEQILGHIKPILEEFFEALPQNLPVSCPHCETFNMLLI